MFRTRAPERRTLAFSARGALSSVSDMAGRPTLTRTAIVLGLCALAYLWVSPYFPGINNPNENVRFYMTAAMVEHGSYEISPLRQRWGWTNDAARYCGRMDRECPPGSDVRYYSVKAPLTSFLGVPGYAVYYAYTQAAGIEVDRTFALHVCRVTATVLPMLLFFAVFHRWLGARARSPLHRDAVFFALALGTLLYGYGVTFVSHSLAAAAAMGSFMLLYDARHSGRISIVKSAIAGFSCAAITALEYPGAIVSAIIAVYALFCIRRWPKLIAFAIGGLVPTLMVMHFQWAAFDSPFRPGHLWVEEASLGTKHWEGLYGLVALDPEAMVRLLFDPAFGLFPTTPLLVLCVPGFVMLVRDRTQRLDALFALAAVLVTYFVICGMNNWRGGWTIGPRYLATIYPFLGWAALRALDGIGARMPTTAAIFAVGTLAASIAISGVQSAYYPHIPPTVDYPMTELYPVLIAHDYAPSNIGRWLFGRSGTASMIPLFGAALLAVAITIGSGALRARGVLATVMLAPALALALLVALFGLGRTEPPSYGDLALITRHWSPPGDDVASRLELELRRNDHATAEDYERLVAVYLDEGRNTEAQRTQRHADSLRAAAHAHNETRAPH
jgi:hypothetical protein